MAGDDKNKVVVNGASSGYTTQDEITLALLQTGGVKRIQTALQQRLDEAGWSQNLREYVERLFRSGEVTTYDDALKLVMKCVVPDGSKGTANGDAAGLDAPNLHVPRDVLVDVADVVKKEVKKVVVMEK
jgi:hypothetical protein